MSADLSASFSLNKLSASHGTGVGVRGRGEKLTLNKILSCSENTHIHNEGQRD